MKKENKVLKMAIPVIAVVVIAESLMLITNLTKTATVKAPVVNVPTNNNAVLPTNKVMETPVFNIVSMTDKTTLKVGEKTTVTVYAVNKDDRSLDAMNLYLKADTKNLALTNLAFDPKMPKPSFGKISTQKDLVVVNYMITET